MDAKTDKLRTSYRSHPSVLLIALVLLVVLIGTATGENEKQATYNVVLITINGLRYSHLGSSGYDVPNSPAIDDLAERSFVFSMAFSQSGYTMPAMMSMFTSLYPESHNVMDGFKDRLSLQVKTLAEVFKENGYQTAGFWMIDHPHMDINAGFGRGFRLVGRLRPNFEGLDLVLEWLRHNKDKPLFLALNTQSTHLPYIPLPKYKNRLLKGRRGKIIHEENSYMQAIYLETLDALRTPGSRIYGVIDEEVIEANSWLFDGNYLREKIGQIKRLVPPKYQNQLAKLQMDVYFQDIDIDDAENMRYFRSLYDACILGVDQELVKPILKLLRKLGIRDRTIVILTADHGAGLGEHLEWGPGTHFWDEYVHVPLIIDIPGSSRRRDQDELVQTIDLMPTILELTGIAIPSEAQGESLVSIMKGYAREPPNEVIFGSNRVRAFYRSKKWKLIVWRNHLDQLASEKDELYNLLDDPKEQTNLRDSQGKIYREIRKKLREHLESVPRYIDEIYTYPAHVDEATRNRIRETGYW